MNGTSLLLITQDAVGSYTGLVRLPYGDSRNLSGSRTLAFHRLDALGDKAHRLFVAR